MKTYYLIKAFARNNLTKVERFHYFGKQNSLLGYIREDGILKYSKDDIRDYGFRSFPKAQDAAKALAALEMESGWSLVITLIAETA